MKEDTKDSFNDEYNKILKSGLTEEGLLILRSGFCMRGSIDKNGKLNNSIRSLKIGSYTNNENYKAFLTFELSRIPKDASIKSAKLVFNYKATNKSEENSVDGKVNNIDYGIYLDETDYNTVNLSTAPVNFTLPVENTNFTIDVTAFIEDARANLKPQILNESQHYMQLSLETLSDSDYINIDCIEKDIILQIEFDGSTPIILNEISSSKQLLSNNNTVAGFEQAVYIHVSISGDDTGDGTISSPFRTINKGINYAAINDYNAVKVSEGTYNESIVMSSGVSILGGYSSDFSQHDMLLNDYRTKINGMGTGRCIKASDIAEWTVIEGFVITNGNLTGWNNFGAGIYATNCNNSLIIRNNEINNNTSQISYGGGMMLWHSSAQVYANKIINNNSGYGGGLYLSSGNANIHHNEFKNNSAAVGGAIYAYNSTINLHDNVMIENNNQIMGGIILLNYSSGEIHNNQLKNNTQGYIWLDGAYNSMNIHDNTIVSNSRVMNDNYNSGNDN